MRSRRVAPGTSVSRSTSMAQRSNAVMQRSQTVGAIMAPPRRLAVHGKHRPVHLARLFRGKFLAGVKEAYHARRTHAATHAHHLESPPLEKRHAPRFRVALAQRLALVPRVTRQFRLA
jgi:hypothetical protein